MKKGFVKLSNANQSSSETEATTPKAVKIVNDRLNAVVDSAPSDLDTLNKLAQAISNNPKFAESVTQLLSQKLAKNENGADIPNLFLKNLGLTETVVPVGVPLPWPIENPPAGWLKCNGDTFDKVACPQLAAVYPSGRTPDLRGEFIRGWDDGRGINPGRALLSLEDGALQSHKHGYRDRYYVEHVRSLGLAEHEEAASENHNNKVGSRATDSDNDYFLYIDSTTSPSGGSEIRPRNVAFNYMVRAA